MKTFEYFFVTCTHKNCQDQVALTVMFLIDCHLVRSSLYSTRLSLKVPVVRLEEKVTETEQISKKHWKCMKVSDDFVEIFCIIFFEISRSKCWACMHTIIYWECEHLMVYF
jgi:hypothetical protein